MSRRKATKIYNVPELILRARINSRPSRSDTRLVIQNLTKLEEQIIVDYVLNRDSRGFSP
jgi:hypothetical protein